MKIITGNEFNETIKEGVVLVDFYADWCGPCRAVAPVLEELSTQYDGKAEIVKVNIDEERALAEKYGIMSIPTMILFKNGEIVKQVVGVQPKAQLETLLNNAI